MSELKVKVSFLCVCAYTCINTCSYIKQQEHMYVYTYACRSINIGKCRKIQLYKDRYGCRYRYRHTHTHTHTYIYNILYILSLLAAQIFCLYTYEILLASSKDPTWIQAVLLPLNLATYLSLNILTQHSLEILSTALILKTDVGLILTLPLKRQ